MTTAMTAVQSKGFPVAGSKEPDVNGLPLSMVHQWQEYPTKRSFAVSVPRSYVASITPMMPLLVKRCVRRVMFRCAPEN